MKNTKPVKSEKSSSGFPENFVWGAATSSYQIEGGTLADGKDLSDWDLFCGRPGVISGSDTGEKAYDHYRLWKEDVEMMAEIGLKAYRFSISWPRVFPEGTGKVNEKGLDFYDRLVDSLAGKGIEPWITLFHWNYPQALFRRSGWLNSNSSDWLADYAEAVVKRLSDRVRYWMTINEPQIFIGYGHQTGVNAPGLKLAFPDVLRASHNCLLGHGKTVSRIRACARKKPSIGAALVGVVKMPATEAKADIEAGRRAMFEITEKDCWNNSWFADPMILSHYPEDGLRLFKDDMFEYSETNNKTICQPLDFYGVNIYTSDIVSATPASSAPVSDDSSGKFEPKPKPKPESKSKPRLEPILPGTALSAMEWPVVPESLYWGPRFLYERYGVPIVISENGMANCDWIQLDGKVHDPQRIDYLTRYLREYKTAIDDETEAVGYFQWSLMDNFEWAHGYRKRFGLVHVDYQTQKRTLKDSAS